MPLYTYKCKPNEHLFEVQQKFTDDPVTACPECGGEVRRVINSVGIVFKGKGFYVTDTRNAKNGNNGSNKKGDKSETKSESKSDNSTAKSESASGSKKEASKPASDTS